ncbi:hypothetical protein [Saccharothrix hoggarensis]|uniref:Uncharacterized protein n=1 Tax=Saccharothrix hoggarensis TaxID=913853 RepID=A0ABW3R1E8_9PSEU
MSERRTGARLARLASADALDRQAWPEHVNNGEEGDYPYVANYGKGLPHDEVGEVRPEAYRRPGPRAPVGSAGLRHDRPRGAGLGGGQAHAREARGVPAAAGVPGGLGEAVGIGVPRDHVRVCHEDASFGLTRFDGRRVTI